MYTFNQGLRRFREGYHKEHHEMFSALSKGQFPDCLFIACSDSRVLPSRICDADPGELFMIRNIANMVPPWDRAAEFLSVSSAIEYAVGVLKVSSIVVCGHSGCGGCRLLMDGGDGRLPLASSWVNMSAELNQRYEREDMPGPQDFERANVCLQIRHLQQYPIIARKCEEGKLTLLGWHYIIESGMVYQYDTLSRQFILLN